MNALEIISLDNNFFNCNCYIVMYNDEYFIIDPAVSYEEVIKYTKNKILKGILITHCHFDHTQKIETYLNKNALFYMSKRCYENIIDPTLNGAFKFDIDISVPLALSDVIFVTNNMKINLFTDKTVKAIAAPGHSDCSIMYVIDDCLFSGDVLFYRSIGRTDLINGSELEMKKTLKELLKIEKLYQVYPGHDRKTSLEDEKKYNKYLKNLR